MIHQSPSPYLKPKSLFALLLVATLILSGCSLPCCAIPTLFPPNSTPLASPTPLTGPVILTAAPSSTAVPVSPTATATSTSIPASPTATLTSIPPASASPQPSATSSPQGGDIILPSGTTAVVLQGTLTPGQTITYFLEATQSQAMIVILDSPNKDVTLGIFEPHGTMLLDPAKKLSGWQGVLPYSGMYTFLVTGGGTIENYTLTVKIAQPIHFAAGQSSANLSGTTKNRFLVSYGLDCSAGQTMAASLVAPANTLHLDIFGISGSLLLSDTANATTWSGVLPQTDTYVIEVIPNAGQEINYILTVSCTGAPSNAPSSTPSSIPSATPTMGASSTPSSTPTATTAVTPLPVGSIIFSPGTTAAVNQGIIQHGEMQIYTVQANQYQPLILRVESPRNDVTLGVLSPEGNIFLDPAKKYSYWRWQLPESGLYTIEVIGGAATENYTLTTKIAQLVTFPAGSNSVTLSGHPYKGYIHTYAFRLSAGVILTVSLNTDSSKAYLDVYGLATGTLLDQAQRATSWTGTLPLTQEYIVEVIPQYEFAGNYILTVSKP